MKTIKSIYYKLHYFIAVGGVIHVFAKMDLVTGAELPCDYTWGERYILRIEWLKRRSEGIEGTFDELEREYLDNWNKKFKKAYHDMLKERDEKNNDWWT